MYISIHVSSDRSMCLRPWSVTSRFKSRECLDILLQILWVSVGRQQPPVLPHSCPDMFLPFARLPSLHFSVISSSLPFRHHPKFSLFLSYQMFPPVHPAQLPPNAGKYDDQIFEKGNLLLHRQVCVGGGGFFALISLLSLFSLRLTLHSQMQCMATIFDTIYLHLSFCFCVNFISIFVLILNTHKSLQIYFFHSVLYLSIYIIYYPSLLTFFLILYLGVLFPVIKWKPIVMVQICTLYCLCQF